MTDMWGLIDALAKVTDHEGGWAVEPYGGDPPILVNGTTNRQIMLTFEPHGDRDSYHNPSIRHVDAIALLSAVLRAAEMADPDGLREYMARGFTVPNDGAGQQP